MEKPTNIKYIQYMLERVTLFQLHQHPAWDVDESFESRIAHLPLYALEFNNPDRDSSKHGPTISHYSPARCEIVALSNMCKLLGNDVTLLDVGCGNGFIGSLLAREGIRVIGIDNLSWKRPQICPFHDAETYELRIPCSLREFSGKFQVALCSWMSPGHNLSSELLARHPELVIHVYSPDKQGDGSPTTGNQEAYKCKEPYMVLGRWLVKTPQNYFSILDPRFSSKRKELRIVEIWKRQDAENVHFVAPNAATKDYHWDSERRYLNSIRIELGLKPYDIPTSCESWRI